MNENEEEIYRQLYPNAATMCGREAYEFYRAQAKDKRIDLGARIFAGELCEWYKEFGFYSKRQRRPLDSWYFKAGQNKGSNKEKLPAINYIYAVTDEDCLKLGTTNNLNKRIVGLQIGNPRTLYYLNVWPVSRLKERALAIEKGLHEACEKYFVRGEWFASDCIDVASEYLAPLTVCYPPQKD